jgi:type VI secretion system protein ImpE
MLAVQALRAGRPEEALKQLQDLVRKDPASPAPRIFLFQLLAVLGQWERASSQLEVLGEMDAGTLAMVAAYRQALACEGERRAVFAGEARPLLLGEPEPWMARLLEALRLTAAGRFEEGAAERAVALEAAPTTSGTIDGQAFQWIADADSRMGPMLETFVRGRYCWIPFHHLRRLELERPTDLRDLVWTPAELTFANGGSVAALLPARYPGSEAAEDALRMARRTDWTERPGGTFLGLGQRMLATDAGEHPLLETKLVELAG